MLTQTLRGIIPSLNTPFKDDADHGVDFESLAEIVKDGIEAGVVGFLLTAFAG